ncbi:MAG: hypothetical protein JST54_31440 [Deltaproteobacteria bacterium]|nr:hypothetical protein [Deltaproteobacteria bacterium]
MGAWALATWALVASGAPGAWEQVSSGEVEVWVRQTPHSGVREVRASKVIHASAERLKALISDEERARHGPHVVEYRSVADPSPGVWIRYARVSVPLMEDRDAFVRVTQDRDLQPDGTGEYHLSWVPWGDDRPTRSGVVRVRQTRGYWDIQSLGNGFSRVEYDLACDPGGMMPSFVVNLVNKRLVPGVLFDLERDALKQPNPHAR